MAKKWAILLTIVAIALVYLFLLVGMPAFVDMLGPWGDDVEETGAVSNVTANLTPVGPPIDVRPYRETYKTPWLLYSVPGLVGAAMIAVIFKKKEAK